jgi:hypothetical protein
LLPYFPAPYPNELLYSTLARYNERRGNELYRDTVYDLFGSVTATAQTLFPCNLERLCAQLHQKSLITPEKLIRENTLFPLYKPFLHKERAEAAFQYMKDTHTGRFVDSRSGLLRFSLFTERSFKYCPECFKIDKDLWGEAYWHRDHQHFGVFTCYKHKELLIDTGLPLATSQNKRQFHLLDKEYQPRSKPRTYSPKELNHFTYIAKAVHLLLNEPVPDDSRDVLNENYAALAIEKGYAHASSIMSHSKVSEAFTKYFGSEFLALMSSELPENATYKNWLVRLLKKKAVVTDPLRHLLVFRFFGETVQNMLSPVEPGRCAPIPPPYQKTSPAIKSNVSRITCKFCLWSTSRIFKDKKGRVQGEDKAYERLFEHVREVHSVEYQKVQCGLGECSYDEQVVRN